MRILMISAEYAPFAKTGGLADMVAGLAKTLVSAGHDVRVLIPHYVGLPANVDGPGGLRLGGVQVSPVAVNGTHPGYSFSLITDRSGTDPTLYVLDAPAFFSGGDIYTGSDLDARRFALLAHAALRLCKVLDWTPDILHCHDWHSALAPALLATARQREPTVRQPATVLTIHNIGYQGIFEAELLPDLGLIDAGPVTELNFLRTGILAADALTTVSPAHATEILTPEYGMGLDGLLRERADRLFGILNGVDYAAWNPASDGRLPAQFSSGNLDGRSICRTELIRRSGLATGPHSVSRLPVLGMVSRLAAQKGLELAIGALPPLLREQRLQAVVLGQGEARYVAELQAMAASFPGQFSFVDAQDESMARLVYAGADAFMVPSLYEPCGLTQLYALRYGAVPIVRETGGLKDTVRHFDTASLAGNGSVFKHADVAGLAWAIGEALNWYQQPELWTRVQQHGMSADFSWQHQAPRFEALYLQLIRSQQERTRQ
ncbi:MAG: glycogen synthase [Gammaproteobacteria bacterium]